MSTESNHKYLNSFTKTIELVPLPIAIVDDDYTLIWANPYLRSSYPYLVAPDSVTSLMHGYNLDKVTNTLRFSLESCSYHSMLPLVSTVLSFSPIKNSRQEFLGALVHFTVFSKDSTSAVDGSSDQMLQGFSANLRGPLSSIFSSVSAISGRLALSDVASCETILPAINKKCYHLLKSSISMVEYARYSSGLALSDWKSIDLTLYLQEILSAARTMLRGEGILLSIDLPKDPLEIYCDPDKIAIVIMSLLSNSANFKDYDRSDGNKIHILVSYEKQYVTITVSDNGVGIPSEVLPHIFEPYYSYGRDSYLYASTGLGLPISKMIASHHGGTVAVNSEPGRGTSVAFTISRSLACSTEEDFLLCDDSPSFIRNRFSPLYVFLSDVCECPEP